jgi:phospholipid transport system transporter-binding protein
MLSPTPGQPGDYRLSGALDFVSVPALLRQPPDWLAGPQVRVDLSGVTGCNSAAVGLLLEWLRRGAARNSELRFVNIPLSLLEIARVSDVQRLLNPQA